MIENLKLKLLEYFSPDPKHDLAIKSLVPFGFTGMVLPHFTSSLPAGFIALDGSTYLKDDFPDLWRFLSEDYTVLTFESSATHFFVPDMRGRVPVGVDSSIDQFDTIGKKYGFLEHTHPLSNNGGSLGVPSGHGSTQNWHWKNVNLGNWASTHRMTLNASIEGSVITRGHAAALIGRTDVTSSIQPSYAVHWIIKT